MFKLIHRQLRFINLETASGIVVIVAALLALVLANSPLARQYDEFAAFSHDAVNDWLIILFFLVIALELKKEIKLGVLAEKGQVALPMLAAIGGMLMPAVIYILFNLNSGYLEGWAIPTATDIAFALSIMLMIGKYLPHSARSFLLAIAIFDDLGAILIIAFFYSGDLYFDYLGAAILLIGIMYLLNKARVRLIGLYIALGLALAWLLHHAGIHTTIAGVITGFTIPLAQNKKALHLFHKWSSFVIVPLFALVNSGLSPSGIKLDSLLHPVTLGIIFGLLIGKQLGILGMVAICSKLKLISRPRGMLWFDVYAVACLAGIGFTMSLFLGGLAFGGLELQSEVKLGVLLGSVFSIIWAYLILQFRKKVT